MQTQALVISVPKTSISIKQAIFSTTVSLKADCTRPQLNNHTTTAQTACHHAYCLTALPGTVYTIPHNSRPMTWETYS